PLLVLGGPGAQRAGRGGRAVHHASRPAAAGVCLMAESLKPPKPPQTTRTVESRVAIRSHPLHPMLVVFPIAFLIMVAPADLLYLWSGLAFWAQLGLVLSAGGLALGLVSAAVGSVDLLLIPVVRRHVSAWSHAL